MKKQSFVVFLLLVGLVAIFFWLPSNRALLSRGEIRAALDIGSGATNLKIAKVNPKTNQIVAQIFEKSIPVGYQKQMEESGNELFSEAIRKQGIDSIKTLKEISDTYQVKKIVAVATAAFRQARNGAEFAKEIEKETGIPVRIISQDEEGILAFRGALALSSIKPHQAITWDIGGGSMQLTMLSQQGSYLVEKGKTASIPFKNFVIQNIKREDPQVVHSPNPMTQEEMSKAINYASELAQTSPPYLKKKLLDQDIVVLGVGNLFNFGIREFVGRKIVDQKSLKEALAKNIDKSDSELTNDAHVDVFLTNPLLVLGYMEGLGIQSVDIYNVNNTDGALTYPPYWQ